MSTNTVNVNGVARERYAEAVIWLFDKDGENLRYEIRRDVSARRYHVVITHPDGTESVEQVDACFVFIGAMPLTDWLAGVVARDERGFILAGLDAKQDSWPLQRDPFPLETSVPGVLVAGDVRSRSIKRVASAVGEGSMAVSLIHQYLAEG